MEEQTAEQARELLTKGAAGGWLMLTTGDARATYGGLEQKGAVTPTARALAAVGSGA
jgi:hypothetical protein